MQAAGNHLHRIDHIIGKVCARRILATARLLKLGRDLAVGDVLIYSEGNSEPVARASRRNA